MKSNRKIIIIAVIMCVAVMCALAACKKNSGNKLDPVVVTDKNGVAYTDENGEVISSAPTCPIIVQYMPTNPDADHGPSSDYIAVTPTCVPRGGSIHILALNENSSGEYRITTAEGQFVSRGEYHGAATPVSIPSVEGLYIVQVWSDNKESKESYRAIKVIVKDTCPNCDKSSF
jgi:hypothetical protein